MSTTTQVIGTVREVRERGGQHYAEVLMGEGNSMVVHVTGDVHAGDKARVTIEWGESKLNLLALVNADVALVPSANERAR